MNLLLRGYLMSALVLTLLHDNVVAGATRTKPKLVKYSIPENRELKKALGFNQDIYFNFTELTTKYGYATEQHEVITEDGYILTVFRILPKCSAVQVRKFHPVLLVHGIIDSSDLWIISGTKTGLGYILSDNCYDVWAINSRGNRYSRKHMKLDPDTDPEFWKFSFDEFGNYDLPAVIDYILYTSKRPRLYYVGHSQGTTNFFVMNSLRPEYNNKIRLSIQLAPVAWLKHIKSPVRLIAAQGAESIGKILEAAGYNEILARDQIIHTLMEFACHLISDQICAEILSFITGYNAGIGSKTLSTSFGHLAVGISSRGLLHFGQLVISKKFQRFDEGREDNLKRYGIDKPPNYNISRITSPVVLINAHNDLISTLEDNKILESKLPNVVESYVVPEQYWSHHNHVWGVKAPKHVYPKILRYFNEYDLYYA